MTDNSDGGAVPDRSAGSNSPWIPARPSGSQGALLRALKKLDPSGELPSMYCAATIVLQQLLLPDRLALAGHAMRELMEKLPRHADFVLTGQRGGRIPNLIAEVQVLRDSWVNSKKGNRITAAEQVGHRVVAEHFCRTMDRFCEAFDSHYPRKHERTNRVLTLLDPAGIPLPETIQKQLIERWQATFGFFAGVSHHQKRTDDQEFGETLAWLEGFLLDRLKPTTFDDQEALDRIITEAERP